MNLLISLIPMTATQNDPVLGEVVVEFDQFIIMAESESLKAATGQGKLELGYVCKGPGMPINFLPTANRWPENVRQAIAEEVKKRLAELQLDTTVARKTNFAPPKEVVDSAIAASQSASAAGDTEGSEQNL